MNLAFKYPITFWNCACLISDAGGNETEEIDEEAIEENNNEPTYYNEMEEFTAEDNEEDVESEYEEGEDCDGYPVEVEVMKNGKKKKKVKATNYGKIASAIGKIQSTGVTITPPDINDSTFTFSPDIKNNAIRYGLSGITNIGEDLVKEIISNRPYTSINDFIDKVKVKKPQMINLIKSGAFDNIGGDRIEIMSNYIDMISDKKKRITLQNMAMLIKYGLIPPEYEHQIKVFNFNKYLKQFKDGTYYDLDDNTYRFYEQNYNIDKLIFDGCFKINQTYWDNTYSKEMDTIRAYFKSNQEEILNKLNNTLYEETFNKYCTGTISKWEMDSLSTYIHPHEMYDVNNYIYNFVDFFSLPDNPIVERTFVTKEKKVVPMYKIFRIAGTVLDRDKAKKTVTLLTTKGVVTVKIYGVFQQYDKQISERGADGKKHVLRKSEFTRGNKIIVCGIKQDNMFMAKKYKNTPYHTVERIAQIESDGTLIIDNRQEDIE